jgi:hypothetical protein
MASEGVQPRSRVGALGSYLCLLALLPWYLFCNVSLQNEDPVHWLAGVMWLVILALGASLLTFVGTVLGLVASYGNGWRLGWATPALVLNALIFLAASIPLLWLFGTIR